MAIRAFALTPNDYAPALNVLGTKVTVLASSAVTGAGEVTLQSGDEGTGPPLHRHNWDESFFVLEGEVEFLYDGASIHCGPGTLVHLPAGTEHGFRYGPMGGKMLEFTGRGSKAARMFTAMNDAIPPGSRDIPKAIDILAQNGVTVAA